MNTDWLAFVLIGSAVWRLSLMATKESGPFHVFEKVRELAGIQHDTDGNVLVVPHKLFAELLSCVWCASIWVALGFAIAYYFFPAETQWVALPFSLSALAIALDKLFN